MVGSSEPRSVTLSGSWPLSPVIGRLIPSFKIFQQVPSLLRSKQFQCDFTHIPRVIANLEFPV